MHTVQDELEAASLEFLTLIESANHFGNVSLRWIDSVRFHDAASDFHRRMKIIVDPANPNPLPAALELIKDYRRLSAALLQEMEAERLRNSRDIDA